MVKRHNTAETAHFSLARAFMEDEGTAKEVRVQFYTQMTQYVVTDTPIAVPAHVRRVQLSQMINHLLALESPRPFDFLVDGEFVRGSLEKFIEEHGLSPVSRLSRGRLFEFYM